MNKVFARPFYRVHLSFFRKALIAVTYTRPPTSFEDGNVVLSKWVTSKIYLPTSTMTESSLKIRNYFAARPQHLKDCKRSRKIKFDHCKYLAILTVISAANSIFVRFLNVEALENMLCICFRKRQYAKTRPVSLLAMKP